MDQKTKIIIIGGGPAGYVAAIRGAQLGAEVCLVERTSLGGTCLNVGCVPTKVLLHAGEYYHRAVSATVPGIMTTAKLDWPSVIAHKDDVVKRMTGGVTQLLQHYQVQVLDGDAELLPGPLVRVGGETLSADAVILAVGSVNTQLRFSGSELSGVIDSTAALSLPELPGAIAIVGGGVIGVEFATLFAYLGADVTIVEMMPEILPTFDREIAGMLREKLSASGIRTVLRTQLTDVKKVKNQLAVHIETEGHAEELTVDKLLVAVGRRPNTADLGLEKLGVSMDRGAILVNEEYQTNIAGLYAVGDCNAKLMLAHAAMDQGISAVENIMGVQSGSRHKNIPSCVYSSPEIACVGMTEEQIREKGIPYETGRFSMSGNGKAIIEGSEGFVKILADKAFGEVLGIHIIGPKVTEMIGEATICMDMEGTVDDIAHAVHAHPTVSESVWEAARAFNKKAIHGM